jgi:EAL domain-containing protein (putative c-di-GMP-specific phosphodiesterase class I)
MLNDEGNAVIVRSTIELAHNLLLTVVAEGVEDEETYDVLASLGCHGAQGFYLGRPVPPALLTSSSTAAASRCRRGSRSEHVPGILDAWVKVSQP